MIEHLQQVLGEKPEDQNDGANTHLHKMNEFEVKLESIDEIKQN